RGGRSDGDDERQDDDGREDRRATERADRHAQGLHNGDGEDGGRTEARRSRVRTLYKEGGFLPCDGPEAVKQTTGDTERQRTLRMANAGSTEIPIKAPTKPTAEDTERRMTQRAAKSLFFSLCP